VFKGGAQEGAGAPQSQPEPAASAADGAAQGGAASQLHGWQLIRARAAVVTAMTTLPLRRAVATIISWEAACLDTALQGTAKRLPGTAPAVARVRRAAGLEDPILSPSSHLGRPRNPLTLALLMPLAVVMALPAMAVGRVALFLTNHNLDLLDSEGKFRKKQLRRAVRAVGNQHPEPAGSEPRPTRRVMAGGPRGAGRAVGVLRTRAASEGPGTRVSRIQMPRIPAAPGRRIKHVVVIMQENHTYDDYFGRLGVGNGDPALYRANDPPTYTLPWLPTHGNWSWRQQRWMAVHEQRTPEQIPVYSRWARQYGLVDDFYCFSRGPSTANHIAHICSSAHNLLDNPHHGLVKLVRRDPEVPPFELDSVPARLELAGRTWGNYGSGSFQYIKDLANSPNNLLAEQFEIDAAQGKLRDVSYLVPPHFLLNEHSPDRVWDGMAWVARQVQAIIDGGHWQDTAVLITWDDYGGYADHVKPPVLEQWVHDSTRPYTLGARVPLLVLSPYVKPDLISRPDRQADPAHPRSFVSIPAFIEKVFGLDPINEYDRNADDLTGLFDFNQKPLPAPDCSLPPRPRETAWQRFREAWDAAAVTAPAEPAPSRVVREME
jgi:phospholipase C